MKNGLPAFLNAVLGRNGPEAIESVRIIENKTLTAEVSGDKTGILDARAPNRRLGEKDVWNDRLPRRLT
jgi:hypothetical protein